MKSFSESYKDAGVDVTAGYKAVELMREHINKTHINGVLTDIGGFGGLFAPDLSGIKQPVLVSGTDGVGTKLKLAFLLDRHDTVGIDCVAMCVNDIVCSGAAPLFFLDYIACGKNVPEKISQLVKGVSLGCIDAGCALIGGETAEMPGFYKEDEYDLAGFSVGLVDRNKIIDGSKVCERDVIVGLASSGVHSNGFSLVRKVFNINNRQVLDKYYNVLGQTLGDTLLTPTKIYVKPLLEIAKTVEVKAVSHITGGGFYENIPRMLPEGCKAVIDRQSFAILPIFSLIAQTGSIPERDMFNTFNMGIGMTFCVKAQDAVKAIDTLQALGQDAYVIGRIEAGERGVEIN